jgi:prevent-host-death family protein
MRRVMISDLKAHLSQYLEAVRNGETIVVCDRKTPIARLEPLQTDDERLLGVQPATQPASMAFSVRRLERPLDVDVVALLREGRDDR